MIVLELTLVGGTVTPFVITNNTVFLPLEGSGTRVDMQGCEAVDVMETSAQISEMIAAQRSMATANGEKVDPQAILKASLFEAVVDRYRGCGINQEGQAYKLQFFTWLGQFLRTNGVQTGTYK